MLRAIKGQAVVVQPTSPGAAPIFGVVTGVTAGRIDVNLFIADQTGWRTESGAYVDWADEPAGVCVTFTQTADGKWTAEEFEVEENLFVDRATLEPFSVIARY
jgi:hypothetical protein